MDDRLDYKIAFQMCSSPTFAGHFSQFGQPESGPISAPVNMVVSGTVLL